MPNNEKEYDGYLFDQLTIVRTAGENSKEIGRQRDYGRDCNY